MEAILNLIINDFYYIFFIIVILTMKRYRSFALIAIFFQLFIPSNSLWLNVIYGLLLIIILIDQLGSDKRKERKNNIQISTPIREENKDRRDPDYHM